MESPIKRITGDGVNYVLFNGVEVQCSDCKTLFKFGYFCTCSKLPVCSKCMLDAYPPLGNSHVCVDRNNVYEHPKLECKKVNNND